MNMRNLNERSEAGFTMVELTIVVVISLIALTAIYQTLITQERTYRFQSSAIQAQGTSRLGLQVLTSELREISASAGSDPANLGGSDLLETTADSLRFRAFRKIGFACAIDTTGSKVHLQVPGMPFTGSDTLALFLEGDTLTDADDAWAINVPVTGEASAYNGTDCAQWGNYPRMQTLSGISSSLLGRMERGALVRSYEVLTYGPYEYDDEWVLGRRSAEGAVVPLVGPILPPEDGGIVFRYFDRDGNELTPSTETQRAAVNRIDITIRGVGRGGLNNQDHVDSLSTTVYLRGN